MTKLYIFIIIIFFSVSFSAQSFLDHKDFVQQEIGNYEKMTSFNVNPNTLNYDLKYQRMEVFLDPAVLLISGSVTSHFLPNAEMSSIYFDFTDRIPVSEILYHGANLSFQQLATKELKINFPATLPANTLDSLTVKYEGVPDNSGRTYFYVQTHNGNPVLATLSEPYGAQTWFPTKQSMNDKIDEFDLKITTPAPYSVGSNGKLMSENLIPGNKKTTFWRTQYPTAAYLIALSIGGFNKTSDVIGAASFPYLNYLYPDTATNPAVLENIEYGKTAMTIFEEYFGPYPFSNEKYGHVEIAINGAAIEHQTMSGMNSFAKSTVAHELSHQWFGDKITCGSWNEAWLNEGFATFSEHLIFEKNLMSHAEFLTYLSTQINTITSLPNGKIYVDDANLGNIATVFSGRLTYVKGGFALRMIKWILGDAIFYQMLKDYVANPNFAYKYATTEDFKNQISVSTGKDFTGFFNDWIYGEGFPTYTIKWNQKDNFDLKFLVSQTQSDSSVNFFELPLPIKVSGTNGETVNLVLDNTSNNEVFSKSVNFEVANVDFNTEFQIIEKNSTITYDAALSADSYRKDEMIILFPNPVKNDIKMQGIRNKSAFQIYSMEGKLMKKGIYEPNSSLSVSELNSGIYILKINGNNLKFVKK